MNASDVSVLKKAIVILAQSGNRHIADMVGDAIFEISQKIGLESGVDLDFMQIMHAELKADVYSGPKCEEHRPVWNAYFEGDKQGDISSAPIVFDVLHYPIGSRLTAEVPVCPECEQDAGTCQALEECEFDWKSWAEKKYG